jgi:hypothetical protein
MVACGASGQCVSLDDIHTCGSCANDCTQLPLAGTTGLACTGGRCTYECAPGHADCAGDGTGCAADLSTPATCGACGNDCTALPRVSGPTTCTASACTFPPSSCAAGWADCNGDPSDGCETDLSLPTHCGTCTTMCGAGTALCAASGATFTCAAGCAGTQTLCGSSCIDPKSDANHCGTCANACTTTVAHGQATCTDGACTLACNGGSTNCSGTCSDTTSDLANCGTCGHACPAGATCQGSQCACSGPATEACGQCGTQTRTCTAGAWSGWSACTGQGVCAAAATKACGTNEIETCTAACAWGACGCSAGHSACGSACVDEQTDPANCGACGATCPGTCSGGKCTKAVAIAGGDDMVCAAISDGTVWCWGENVPLSNGSYGNTPTPVEIYWGGLATGVAVGNGRACAVLSDTTLQCWGPETDNTSNDGTLYGSSYPVPIGHTNAGGTFVPLTNVASVAIAEYNMCALMLDGTVQCWGDAGDGELGNGSMGDSADPTPALVTHATAVAAGRYHMCAATQSSVSCWGDNSDPTGLASNPFFIIGEIPSATLDFSATPISAGGGTGVASGDQEGCAFQSFGINCWGYLAHWGGDVYPNGYYYSPSAVPGLSLDTGMAVTAVSMAEDHACALVTGTASGTAIECWGHNDEGELGQGTGANPNYPEPDPYPHWSTVQNPVQVAVTDVATCALIKDGTVQCWGDNTYGQLGNGTMSPASTPTPSPITVPW